MWITIQLAVISLYKSTLNRAINIRKLIGVEIHLWKKLWIHTNRISIRSTTDDGDVRLESAGSVFYAVW